MMLLLMMTMFQSDTLSGQSFLVPSKLPSLFSNADDFYLPTVHDVVFYFSFCSFLPGLRAQKYSV